MMLTYYFYFILFKIVISGWDVTFGIKAMVFQRFLGLGE